MSKRVNEEMESGATLINSTQRQRHSSTAHMLMMILMMFSIINYTALLLCDDPYGGNKSFENTRVRVDFDSDIASSYTDHEFRRVYRMSKDGFNHLHHMLVPQLLKNFFPQGGGTRNPKTSKYLIDTKICLSVALRYFSGGDPLDLFGWHGISIVSVFVSVWGVIDAVNNTDALAFSFPNADEQRENAKGFLAMSGASFSNVIGTIDGILIWTRTPSLAICDLIECGQSKFVCSRKDKSGLNMQAICDHRLRFVWIDINWPGSSSDYMAWITSSLYAALENNEVTKIILKGMTLLGDNAYIKKMFMAVPLKGVQSGYCDAYNFYQSQLRITIERAFGVLVHRWAILRSPLNIPLQKVTALLMCLCRLHK